MLPGLSAVHPGGSAHSGIITLVDHQSGSGKDNATYTFGEAWTGRVIAVGISYAAGAVISSVTIGGVSATKQVAQTENDGIFGESHNAEIWTATVPTGTSGNITCTLASGSYVGFAMSVYSIGTVSETPTDSDKTSKVPAFDGDPINLSVTLTVATANSTVMGVGSMARISSSSSTWSHGPTEDVDVQYLSYVSGTTASKMGVPSGAYQVEVDMDQHFTLNSGVMATACWDP